MPDLSDTWDNTSWGGGGSPRNKAKVRVPKAGGNVLKSAGMLESKLKSQAQN